MKVPLCNHSKDILDVKDEILVAVYLDACAAVLVMEDLLPYLDCLDIIANSLVSCDV